MSKLREYVEHIYKLAEENPVEVYNKYFAQDAVTIDLDGSKTEGLENHITAMEKWASGIEDMKPSTLKGYVISGDENDGTVISIWHYEFKHKEWGDMNYDQASVTKWKDGKVVHEQFFAEMPS